LRYGEYFVLTAKGVTVLQGKNDRLVDIFTCFGMEKMLTRQPFLLQVIVDKKLKNVEYFNHLGCLVQYLHAKLNIGFLWKKQDLTRRRRFFLQF
jgi:hypothetical protein